MNKGEPAAITPELYKAIIAIVDERIKDIRVTREDFDELRGVVKELAQAQSRTEERMGRLEEAVERLAQAQSRTEERMGRLEEAVERLAQAQARTEEEVRNLAQQVGKLSENIGSSLEDIAKVVLPGYLERHFNIHIDDELERRFFVVDSEEIEMNIYGEGKKNGKKVVILGEVKSRIYEREVEGFIQEVSKLLPVLKGKGGVFKVMFGYLIHPSAAKLGEAQEVILVASYQR
ncbi:MAG: hypothetical protein QMD22_03605 [archaeon]|nr:hypothetical protein [archaeon]